MVPALRDTPSLSGHVLNERKRAPTGSLFTSARKRVNHPLFPPAGGLAARRYSEEWLVSAARLGRETPKRFGFKELGELRLHDWGKHDLVPQGIQSARVQPYPILCGKSLSSQQQNERRDLLPSRKGASSSGGQGSR